MAPPRQATFDASQLSPGQYNVTANFPGDANYTASTSAVVRLNLAADFSVADQGITSQSVVAGQTASYINDLVVTPFFGFSSTVTVSCSVPARGTTCSIDPSSYPLANGLGIGTVSVATTGRGVAAALERQTKPLPFGPPIWPSSVLALSFCAMVIPSARANRRRFLGALLLTLLLVLVMGMQLVGCGGGSSGGGGGGATTGTPAGSYTVTVMATFGTVTHTTTLTLIVR